MTFPGVPWFVGGGAENPPEAARLLAHVATSGAGGVLLPDDCAVSELAVPAGQVRVAAGAVVVPNTKPNANGEVYLERNPDDHLVAIAPTDASGPRSDLVYYRVADPQYTDEPAPSSVTDGPYSWVEVAAGVSATCTTVEQAIVEGVLPAGRVGLALARVDMPASTGTVTDAEIVDVRAIPRPRSLRRQFTAFPAGSENLTSSGYTTFPNPASWSVEVPEWATHAIVHATIAGARHTTNNAVGDLRVVVGSVNGQACGYDLPAGAGTARDNVHAIDTLNVRSIAGTTVTLKVEGRRTGGSGSLDATSKTAVIADIEFQERV